MKDECPIRGIPIKKCYSFLYHSLSIFCEVYNKEPLLVKVDSTFKWSFLEIYSHRLTFKNNSLDIELVSKH